jgi:hypothetical protein
MQPKVFYLNNFLSNLLIGKNFGGRHYYWVILLRNSLAPEVRKMLLVHEMWHHKQAHEVGPFKYAWKYFFNDEFRFISEKEAYVNVNHRVFGQWPAEEALNEFIIDLYNINRDKISKEILDKEF